MLLEDNNRLITMQQSALNLCQALSVDSPSAQPPDLDRSEGLQYYERCIEPCTQPLELVGTILSLLKTHLKEHRLGMTKAASMLLTHPGYAQWTADCKQALHPRDLTQLNQFTTFLESTAAEPSNILQHLRSLPLNQLSQTDQECCNSYLEPPIQKEKMQCLSNFIIRKIDDLTEDQTEDLRNFRTLLQKIHPLHQAYETRYSIIVIQSTMRGHLARNETQKQKASMIGIQRTASNMQRFCFKWGIRLLYITTAWIITYYLQYHDLINTHTSISSLTHLSNSLLPSVVAVTLLLIIYIANDILPACWSNNPPQINQPSAPIVKKQAASQEGYPPPSPRPHDISGARLSSKISLS